MSHHSMFQGYFKKFEEVKRSSNIFNDNFWINREFSKIQKLKKQKPHEINLSRDYPLLVAASIISGENKKLKIIDFGGGLGKGYLSISRGLKNKNISYIIIDLPEVCKFGKKLFKNEKKITFLYEIPSIHGCDIFHFGSCMQYIENWKLLIDRSCKIKSKYIIFSDLIAGDIKSFVTAQKFNQITMPYKFYNINQIIKFIKKRGYELILRNNYQVNFNGVLSLLPTKKFPKESRLQYSSNLIFKKNET